MEKSLLQKIYIKLLKAYYMKSLELIAACLYRVNEVLFIADIKCIGAVPENNIDNIAEIHEIMYMIKVYIHQ